MGTHVMISAVVLNSLLLTSQVLTILLYCLLDVSLFPQFYRWGNCPLRKRENSFKVQNHLITVLVLGCREGMAPHSSTLAWKIPWMEEPGGLQSMGLPRVRHDWATSLYLLTFMHWRRKWQPTPVFLPGESEGQGILVGCRLWGRTESDTTEVT